MVKGNPLNPLETNRQRKLAKRSKGEKKAKVSKDNSLGRAYIVSLARKHDWRNNNDNGDCLVFENKTGVKLHFRKGSDGRFGSSSGGGIVGWESSSSSSKRKSTMIWRSIMWSQVGALFSDR
ncbi:hypothetical protein TrST_g2614 [Triparma strigata]|uniref:Uncharacterized protein n=1 Tax=Triparma strigata TaxID=1606541 RepID=A0A9W7AF85_9STRA|nr:hypothetical protein TrST_g2614 [Triparma strigata]